VFPVQLTKTYRQSDQQFVDILTRIRLNRNHKESVAKINRECFRDKVQVLKTDDVTLVPTNASARTINERELGKLNGAAVSIEAIITGNVPLNKWNISVPSVLRLKVGAKVIFMKNKKPFWINGDLGIVTDILDNSIQVRKLASDNIVSVDKEIWEKFNYEYNYSTKTLNHNVVASFEQFPLSLGWAITIHKSQGMTLDEVTIDLGAGAFSPGQTYVALSRARSIEGITLIKPISMTDVHADQTAIKFYQSLGLDEGHYSD
jgi:S-adenosylmethionine:tRNA-ribosyltransferase-isomerase (queuine synthetase)